MSYDSHRLWREHQATIGSGVELCPLPPSLVAILASRLGTIFSVTWATSVHIAMALARSVPESEWRHEWDRLGYAFYTTGREPVSKQLL